jgi:hypothetical protein
MLSPSVHDHIWLQPMHENHRSSEPCIVTEDYLLTVAALVTVIQALLAFPSWQPTRQLLAATTVYCNRILFRVNEIDNPVQLVLEMIEIVCYFDGKQ